MVEIGLESGAARADDIGGGTSAAGASESAMRSAAEPLVFNGTVGLYAGAQGTPRPLAVLFASAWGLEEMCSRKFFRIMAERLAAQGIASLRFDYPGTGDALDEADGGSGVRSWCDTLIAAAGVLGARSGCQRVVVVAQGIGAVIATLAARDLPGLEGIAYLAPVVSGRVHVRELGVFSRMIDESLGLKPEADGSVRVAGLSLPRALAEDLRRIDLNGRDEPAAKRAIVFSRPDRPSDKAFADRLRETGCAVADAPFDGYEKLTSNPTMAVVPHGVVAGVVAWVSELAPRKRAGRAPAQRAGVGSHEGTGFRETVLRFGDNGRLFGILCAPPEGAGGSGPTALLISSGYDRLSGWGRATVDLARGLARRNIGSLRFDCANVADSPPLPGHEGQVLYDAVQLADVGEALDFLERSGMTPVVAAGRCSGAYLGFQAALRDDRIAGLVAVNPVVFQWQEGRSVDEALENPVQTLEYYGRRFLEPAAFKRVLRGEVDVVGKGAEVIGRLANRAARSLGHVSARERAVLSGFRSLRDRKVDIRLLYSAGDIGLDELRLLFGKDAGGLRQFPNVHCTIVPGADHNFTPGHARNAYLEAILSSGLSARRAWTRP